ncbi:MAG: hypothetical protein KDB46_00030 [Solirubrobacterales bacterium]|nr:hypothetical protein [Solirubrobacterales bacterium]
MDAKRMFLGGTRAMIGIGGWLAPDLTARAFGFDPAKGERFVTRLFAARELALATALLAAGPTQLPAVAAVGAAVDTADVISGLDETRRGNLSNFTFVSGVLGAALFAAIGARIAQEASEAAGDS